MNGSGKAAVSLATGIVAFVVVGVAVSELLVSYIWPSTMVGLPAGVFAGTVSILLTYLGLTYWDERRTTGEASPTTRRRLRTLFGAIVGFVVGGVLTVSVLWTMAVGLGTAMFFVGVPVGLLSAVVAGFIAFRWNTDEHRPPDSTNQ